LELNKKIEYMIEEQDKLHKSIQNNRGSPTYNNINNNTTTTEADANGGPG
jgi:hypothetical protein